MASDRLHLRLLSLNCLGVPFMDGARARLTTLARDLEAGDRDLACLQEVQYIGYVPLLRRLLPSYPHVAYRSARLLHAPLGGLVTFARQPVARLTFSRYAARGQIAAPTLADRLLQKGLLLAYLDLDGQPLVVANTHLLANYSGDWSGHNRYTRQQHQQLLQLKAWLHAIDPSLPLVLVGDFNIPRGGWLYDSFVAGLHLTDLLADSREPTYRQSALMPGRYAQAIDFVFVRVPPGWRLEAAADLTYRQPVTTVDGRRRHLSDHLAITAEITLTR